MTQAHLDRRQLLRAGTATAATLALPAFAQGLTSTRNPELAKLFDTFFYEGLTLRPEGATQLGLDKGPRADLRAKSSLSGTAGRDAARAQNASQLARIEAFDPSNLGTADRIDYDVVLYQRRASADVAKFDFGGAGYGPSPYVISQQSGAYQSTPDFLDTKQPVETAADADAYLARLGAFGDQLTGDTERFRHDVALGVVPPDFILDLTRAQMTALRVPAGNARVVQSLAIRAAAKGLGDTWGSKAAAIYDARVLPALDAQLAAVTAARANAKSNAGIWDIPQADAFYRVALQNTTTTRLTPEEVHKFGIEQGRELKARMDAILKQQGYTKGSVGERLQAINTLPGQVFPDTDAGKADAIAFCNERLAAILPRLPRMFNRTPQYKFEVRRVPKETEAGAASAFAQPPAIDGSRPGLVYFNLKDSAEWPRYIIQTVTYHEGLPGHQYEGGLALSNTGLPLIRKTGGFSGYGEGWALYAEQVADELGMYEDDPLGQLGYLKMRLFRANRCIIDTGLHHYKWTKARAIAQFVDDQGETPGFATREVERYCVNPGQACSYLLGYKSFVDLRGKAQAALGSKFDIKAWHDAVLGIGRVPLEILEARGTAWVKTQV
ncbi:MAG: DUF885 family protein [Pseudomonadota bacterium]